MFLIGDTIAGFNSFKSLPLVSLKNVTISLSATLLISIFLSLSHLIKLTIVGLYCFAVDDDFILLNVCSTAIEIKGSSVIFLIS